jgi:hypothetical protein
MRFDNDVYQYQLGASLLALAAKGEGVRYLVEEAQHRVGESASGCKECGGSIWPHGRLCKYAAAHALNVYRRGTADMPLSTPHLLFDPTNYTEITGLSGISYIWGAPGTGKTNRIRSAARKVPFALPISERDVIDVARRELNGGDFRWKILRYWPVLLLDDLGSYRNNQASDSMVGKLLELIDEHMEYGLGLYVTSNLSPTQLIGYLGDRVGRRLLGGYVEEVKRSWR